MKVQTALLSLGLVSAAFCVDEYQPITQKTTEVDVGYTPIFGTGGYDNSSTKQSAIGSPMSNNIGAQVKYGIMTNLDVEAAWAFTSNNKDAGNTSGFVQPDLAVKYALSDLGLGFYADLVFPVATGDFNTTPSAVDFGVAPGVVYGKNYGKFQAVARAQYLLNFENGDKFKQSDVLWIYLKPGYSITDALAGYVGLNYQMFGKPSVNSVDGNDGNLITVNPGATFTQNKMLSYELNVPFTLAGKNQGSFWGVSAWVYVTIGG